MKNLRTSKKFKVYREVGKILRDAHPHLFPSRGRRPPLREGILHELIVLHGETTTATNIRIFLRIWTRSTSYLMSVAKGGHRIGIRPGGEEEVQERHRREAGGRIRERRLRRSQLLT
jgi:Activator of osmoprotectant transporter ProP